MKDASWTARSAAPTKSPNWSSPGVSTRPGRHTSRTASTRSSEAGRWKSASTWRASHTSAPTGSRSLRYHRQLRAIGGRFRIVADSDAVSHVLRLTRVSDILRDDGPSPDRGASPAARCEAVEREGMALQVFPKTSGGSVEPLELIGDPSRLAGCGYDAPDERIWSAVPEAVALGLGAQALILKRAGGGSGSSWRSRASRPTGQAAGPGRPDFEHAAGEFVPKVRILYGLAFPVERAAVVRFEAKGEPGSGSVR